MELPTVEMVGPPGPIVVNASDEERYRSKGYRLKGEAEAEVSAVGGTEDTSMVETVTGDPTSIEPVADMESDTMSEPDIPRHPEAAD